MSNSYVTLVTLRDTYGAYYPMSVFFLGILGMNWSAKQTYCVISGDFFVLHSDLLQ